MTNINVARDARIAEKQALLDAGSIRADIFEENRAHFAGFADTLNNPAIADLCSKFLINPVTAMQALAMKTQDKCDKMLRHLSNDVLFSDPYSTPIIMNAIPFAERGIPFSNTDQVATLCEAVDSENRAKMKFKKAYSPATAASQASQVRRLLCDLGIATEHDKALTLNLTHPVVIHIREKAKSKKK